MKARRIAGWGLRLLATAFYLITLLGVFELALELAKGFMIDEVIKNRWISFGGAREVTALMILAFIAARLLDAISKKVYPRLNRGRGWGELIE